MFFDQLNVSRLKTCFLLLSIVSGNIIVLIFKEVTLRSGENVLCFWIVASVTFLIHIITNKETFFRTHIKFSSIVFWYVNKHSASKNLWFKGKDGGKFSDF